MNARAAGDRDLLLDVSRLIWRVWRGGLPTGIDRVCIAYLKHYSPRALAVIQRGGRQFVVSHGMSTRLFDLLVSDRRPSRLRLAQTVVQAILSAHPSEA